MNSSRPDVKDRSNIPNWSKLPKEVKEFFWCNVIAARLLVLLFILRLWTSKSSRIAQWTAVVIPKVLDEQSSKSKMLA